MTPDQAKQVRECRNLIAIGETIEGLRRQGYAEAAIQIAHGRDPENVDPYGPQNHPMRP